MRVMACLFSVAAVCGLITTPALAAEPVDTSYQLFKTFTIDMGEGKLTVEHWHTSAAGEGGYPELFQVVSDKLGGVPAVAAELGGALTAFGDIRMRMQGQDVPGIYTLPPYKLSSSPLMLGPYKVTVNHWEAKSEKAGASHIYQIESDLLKGVPLAADNYSSAVTAFGTIVGLMPEHRTDKDGILGEMASPTWLTNALVTKVGLHGQGAEQVFHFGLQGFEGVTFELPRMLVTSVDGVKEDSLVSLGVIRSVKPGILSVISFGENGG